MMATITENTHDKISGVNTFHAVNKCHRQHPWLYHKCWTHSIITGNTHDYLSRLLNTFMYHRQHPWKYQNCYTPSCITGNTHDLPFQDSTRFQTIQHCGPIRWTIERRANGQNHKNLIKNSVLDWINQQIGKWPTLQSHPQKVRCEIYIMYRNTLYIFFMQILNKYHQQNKFYY